MINWAITKEDAEAISRIVDRVENLGGFAAHRVPRNRQEATMDLTAVHLNGTPLDLAGLADGTVGDLCHDVYGISRYIDRPTGKLTDFFTPRYAAQNGVTK